MRYRTKLTNFRSSEKNRFQNSKMAVCLNHYDYINSCISQLEIAASTPGLTIHSATMVISEIGVDMSVFDDTKHLCSWAGLTPQNNESAGKKKSVHISRAGTYLKPLLIQCANSAIRDKSCPSNHPNIKRVILFLQSQGFEVTKTNKDI